MDENSEYLAFIDYIGKNDKNEYVYRFDLTSDTNTVWGEYFNVAPAAIVPNIQPDKNCLSNTFKVNFPQEIFIAKTNPCYSMQDCIDGIIAMGFVNIADKNALKIDNKPLFFMFGETFSSIKSKLDRLSLNIYDETEIEKGDNQIIEDFLSQNNKDDNPDEEDGTDE